MWEKDFLKKNRWNPCLFCLKNGRFCLFSAFFRHFGHNPLAPVVSFLIINHNNWPSYWMKMIVSWDHVSKNKFFFSHFLLCLAAICKWDIIRNCILKVKNYTDANHRQKGEKFKNVLDIFSYKMTIADGWLVGQLVRCSIAWSVCLCVCLSVFYI